MNDTKENLPTTIDSTTTEVLPASVPTDWSVYFDPQRFDQVQRVAKLFAAARIVPQHFRESVPDCVIAIQMAARLRMDPFLLMQHTYVVHGKFGLEGKFVSALINQADLYEDPLEYDYSGSGEARSCTAWAIRKKTGRKHEATVSIAMAKAEGWLSKAGSKWQTMPDQMLAYRSATFFARRWCPEVLMGMNTADELRDIEVELPKQSPKARELDQALKGGSKSEAKHEEPPAPKVEVVDTETGEVTEDDEDQAKREAEYQRQLEEMDRQAADEAAKVEPAEKPAGQQKLGGLAGLAARAKK